MKKIILLGILFLVLMPFVLHADILQLGPASFVPQVHYNNCGMRTGNMELWYDSSSQSTFYCDLPQLPHLGNIDQIRFDYYDNDPNGSISVSLKRVRLSDFNLDTLAEFSSSVTRYRTDVQTKYIENFTYPTIKSKGYRYFLEIVLDPSSSGGNTVALYGIRFRYFPQND